ncbi:MAG: 5-(carboxyamino)imidazole ribonucleotide mutase [Candidatus Cloacimonetes bacterium]|jgi:5-(carboxyamino)imidazole ribonucleotide mutase|nr:5-(carboxyamino)imidazole ribonucleotide mutase [Candidatus Cloacimonadota bacterium]NLO44195.1 5-(carboxyamino)imidazole ribonucleotide mutase [Candidatus Cloacimonadota bacterium]
MAKVRIILGSKSDLETCKVIEEILGDFGVENELFISSAHRNPEKTTKLALEAEQDGVKVIIACAGLAAHLPGVVAAHTTLPVIGVPIASGALNGVDALYSIAQMPPGVPVACVAINGAKNAAYLAIQILACSDDELREKYRAYKESLKV